MFVAGHKDAGCIALAVPSLPASLEMIESTKKKPDREGMRPGLSSCRRGMPAFTFQRGITVCGWLRSGRIRKPLASSMLGVSVCNAAATTPRHVKLPCVSRKSLERFRAKWVPAFVGHSRLRPATAGSREENASKQKAGARLGFHQSGKVLGDRQTQSIDLRDQKVQRWAFDTKKSRNTCTRATDLSSSG